MDLAPRIEPGPSAPKYAFASERRVEQQFPGVAQALPAFVQGYDRSAESALAILEFLEHHFEVNPAMAAAIRAAAGGIPA